MISPEVCGVSLYWRDPRQDIMGFEPPTYYYGISVGRFFIGWAHMSTMAAVAQFYDDLASQEDKAFDAFLDRLEASELRSAHVSRTVQ